jgi:hypothetical protein
MYPRYSRGSLNAIRCKLNIVAVFLPSVLDQYVEISLRGNRFARSALRGKDERVGARDDHWTFCAIASQQSLRQAIYHNDRSDRGTQNR